MNEVIIPATDAVQEQTRGLGDLPADLSPGARQVSMLTAIARAHEKAFPAVCEALKALEALPDWSGHFLVADKADYNWRTAPWRHYDSFADFYESECAAAFGAWSELQETYDTVDKESRNVGGTEERR